MDLVVADIAVPADNPAKEPAHARCRNTTGVVPAGCHGAGNLAQNMRPVIRLLGQFSAVTLMQAGAGASYHTGSFTQRRGLLQL